ncbi:hypothetical protein QFZ70_003455 [Arthrobacter sp. V1I9]|uniref:hypothetical protein n=1 Tax=Arthrobacter sp. V1I9 TaxID=3042275 RepID=UPI00278E2C8D|nr:hypothetical protein [Arthrobacter sp. V1I9]MDQ0870982.1 hypothetical protein [Arthrobacter sp. V1I9]
MGTPPRVTITATTGSEADDKLNASIHQLQSMTQEYPFRGILVTKHGLGHFSVELSDQVPYGETWESVQATALEAAATVSRQER